MVTPATEPLAVVVEFVARINAHDPTGIVELCTPNHVFIDSLGSHLSGSEKLQQAWAGYFALFPDYRIEIEFAASKEMMVLACGFASATYAKSAKEWRIPAAWRAMITKGKVVEWQVYADNKPVYELLAEA
jgi:ketosteroid isomerase-like protein